MKVKPSASQSGKERIRVSIIVLVSLDTRTIIVFLGISAVSSWKILNCLLVGDYGGASVPSPQSEVIDT
jgi:hypothetical protein